MMKIKVMLMVKEKMKNKRWLQWKKDSSNHEKMKTTTMNEEGIYEVVALRRNDKYDVDDDDSFSSV